MRQALGKGLDALIKQTKETSSKLPPNAVQKISVARVHPNRHQPRRAFDEDSLRELGQSIKQHGLAQPILVALDAHTGEYELIAGERRLRASQLAGLTEIDAIVRPMPEQEQMLALALIENIQREDLNPIDTAVAYGKLMDQHNIAQKDLARYCGKSPSAISNTLRLLELDAEIQKALQNNAITEGHARAILTVPDKDARLRLYHAIMENKASVRQTEDLARSIAGGGSAKNAPKKAADKSADVKAFEDSLAQKLGTKVELKPGARGQAGQLIIHYHSFDELDRLAEKLGHRS